MADIYYGFRCTSTKGYFNVTRKRETRKRGRCMNMEKSYQSNSEIGGV